LYGGIFGNRANEPIFLEKSTGNAGIAAIGKRPMNYNSQKNSQGLTK